MFEKFRKRMKRKTIGKKGQVTMASQGKVTEQMPKIKKIGVLRMASFMGLYGVFIGLITAILTLVFSALLQAIFPTSFSTGGLLSYVSGALALLIYPVFFGGVSFVASLIFTPLMNLVLKIIGGISLKIE